MSEFEQLFELHRDLASEVRETRTELLDRIDDVADRISSEVSRSHAALHSRIDTLKRDEVRPLAAKVEQHATTLARIKAAVGVITGLPAVVWSWLQLRGGGHP